MSIAVKNLLVSEPGRADFRSLIGQRLKVSSTAKRIVVSRKQTMNSDPKPSEGAMPENEARDGSVNSATTELYGALREIASRQMAREKNGGILQTTAVVHEAYFKLANSKKEIWKSRNEFLAAAAVTMRRVLVDEARKRKSAKRGGNLERKYLSDGALTIADHRFESIDIHEALSKLATIMPDAADALEKVIFSGMTIGEIADLGSTSKSTIERRLRIARAWMSRELLEDQSMDGIDD